MWDHPRSRGENFSPRSSHLSSEGSSPLTRGKLSELNRWMSTAGIIPAHAGKTERAKQVDVHGGDHPRSRGENDDGPACGDPS